MKTPEERAAEITTHFYIDQKLPLSAGTYTLDAMIAQAIREAVEAAAPRWIPVGERLPAHGEGDEWLVVFTSFEDGEPTLAVALIDQDGAWIDEHGLTMEWHDAITHWAEPPALPRE